MSRSALGDPPRPGTAEERHPVLAEGISTFRARAAAEGTARRFPRIGGWTAEVTLHPGHGITVSEWSENPLHLTVWGDPVMLSQSAADILAVPMEGQ